MRRGGDSARGGAVAADRLGGPSMTAPDQPAHPRVGLIAIHAALGLGLVLSPSRLLPVGRGSRPRLAVIAARILGGRHLTEAGLLALHPDEPPPRWSFVADGLHGLSMLGLALVSPRARRDALASATLALSLAALAAYEC